MLSPSPFICTVADLINFLEPSESLLALAREEVVNFLAFSREVEDHVRDWFVKRLTFLREDAARRRASSRMSGKSGTGEEGAECGCILHGSSEVVR